MNADDRAAQVGPSRFRRRLTAAFVLVAAVSSGVLAVTTLALSNGYRWRNFRDAAQSEVALALALAPPALDEQGFERLRRAYEANVGTDMVAESDTRSFSSSGAISVDDVPVELRQSAGPPEPVMVDRRGHRYLVVTGIGPGGDHYFFFFAADQIQSGLDEFRDVLAVGWGLTVVTAAGVGHLVARRTLRPVRAAAEASTALASGLLETRLDPSGEDEFGAWAGAFNRMADALADKIRALAAAAERERRFTADVAHELRTPLTSMAVTATLLEGELDTLPEVAQRPATLLVREVRRLRDLVLELLELSRLDSGAEDVHLESLRLRPAVDAVVASLDDRLAGAVSVEVGDDAVALADRARLRRILTNLISNALIHGDGPVTITTEEGDGQGIELHVADRGPGISDEDLPHVFERFFKSDRSRAGQGSGLGLAIADVHARALDRPLQVRNRPGGGAEFILHLRVPSAANGAGPGRDGAVTRARPATSGRRE